MIDILLSTYNGERYLAAQLDSIVAQDYSDWHLYIRDDGSTDNTPRILQDYAERYPQYITFLPADGDNLGAMRSFERLLVQCGNDEYIMFADQDDVWLPHKVSCTLATMQKAESEYGNKAIVVHSDAKIVDADLQVLAPSFWQYANIRPDLVDTNKYYLAIANSITGCAMMMNQAVRKLSLPFYEQAYMHDAWIGIVVLESGGVVIPIYNQLLLYRQHGANVLGATRYRFTFRDWKMKYRLGKMCYCAAHPLVYKSVYQFLFQKIRYFIARM